MIMFDRKTFFDAVRPVFGTMTQAEVDGCARNPHRGRAARPR